MTYEYTDSDGDKLWIDKSRPGNIIIGAIQASRETEDCAAARVPNSHAPALALAILEAAGYGKTEAAGFVRGQVEALVKQAELEAEDKKVDAYRRMIHGTINLSEFWSPWDVLCSEKQATWRARYQAASFHFKEEA